jgi:hypothetical protein
MDGVMKTCFCCKTVKERSLFFKHAQTPDGLHSWCKACCNVGNQKSRAKVNATIQGRAKIFLQNAKKSAKKRNQAFDLEIPDIVGFWNDQNMVCAYSGLEMTLEAGKLNTVSIERIDSNIGYTKDNTILVCQAINRMKSDFSYNDFYMLCQAVTKFLGDDELKLAVGAYK